MVTAAYGAVAGEPACLKIDYVSSTSQLTYSSSADCSAWVPISTGTVFFPATVYAGIGVTSVSAGSSTTAEVDNVNINNVSRVSYTHSTTTGGSYTVRARDVDSNNSAYSVASTATPIAAPPSSGVRWVPGDYVKTTAQIGDSNYLTSTLAQIDSYVNDSAELKGAFVKIGWGTFAPTSGTYDWTVMDAMLARLDGYGKKAIVQIGWKNFNTTNGANTTPADLSADRVALSPSTGVTAAMWRASVMTRFLADLAVFAARYDSDSRIALIVTEELVPSVVNNTGDFTRAGYNAQLERMMPVWGSLFPHTPSVGRMNSLCTYAADLIELQYQSGMGRGDPDAHQTAGATIFNGGDGGCSGTGTRDYRGLAPHENVISCPNICTNGKDLTGTLAQTVSRMDTNKVHFRSWYPSGTASGRTWSDILAILPTVADTTCPTIYASACVTP